MDRVMQGRPLIAGEAKGAALACHEPLSFWGGYDPATGEIIDRRHPLSGQNARGRVLAVPSTRGSSTTSAVLLEAIRTGTAPAALLTSGTDPFLVLASIVALEMYDARLPIVALDPTDFASLRTGQWIEVQRDGAVSLTGQ